MDKSDAKFTPSLLLFRELLSMSMLLNNAKLCIIVHRVLYAYMELLETPDRNYIQKLRDRKIISWTEEYPEISYKRHKLSDQECPVKEDATEILVKDYYNDPELAGKISRSEIILIMDFLDRLMENLIQRGISAVTLAVNLLPECDKKQKETLDKLVTRETEEGNDEFLYMNFIIRSYKYFKDCKDELKEDDLFNSLFFKMKNNIKKVDSAKYIPDFMQVLFELLYRNSKANHIPCEKLKSTISVL